MMTEQTAEIVKNHRVTADTFLMALRCDSIVAEARPGRFVMIRVRPGLDPLLRRPFSICGTRGKDIALILYRVAGRGTAILSGLSRGERLEVLGPLGKGFDPPGDEGAGILVAGGIGIAPLFFLAAAAGNVPMTFLAGFRSASERIPEDFFGPGIPEILLSTDDGSMGHHGPVTDLLERCLDARREKRLTVYTCGPLPMMKRVAVLCRSRDIPCQVSLEANMACGVGACLGCAVRARPGEETTYYHVCRDGPVFDSRTLDWEGL